MPLIVEELLWASGVGLVGRGSWWRAWGRGGAATGGVGLVAALATTFPILHVDLEAQHRALQSTCYFAPLEGPRLFLGKGDEGLLLPRRNQELL